MRRTLIESPFAAPTHEGRVRNRLYLILAMRDSLARGEAPIASVLLYATSGALDDGIPEQRALGIEAGLVWGVQAELTAVYEDLGVSRGMTLGMERAAVEGRLIERRRIPDFESKLNALSIEVRQRAIPFDVRALLHQEIDLDAARAAVVDIAKGLDSLDFIPPEGAVHHQIRIGEAMQALGEALAIRFRGHEDAASRVAALREHLKTERNARNDLLAMLLDTWVEEGRSGPRWMPPGAVDELHDDAGADHPISNSAWRERNDPLAQVRVLTCQRNAEMDEHVVTFRKVGRRGADDDDRLTVTRFLAEYEPVL